MSRLKEILLKLTREESGQDMIEYALVLSFIALAAISTLKTFATTIVEALGTIGTRLTGLI